MKIIKYQLIKMELYQKLLKIKLINIFQLEKLIKVISVQVIRENTKKMKINPMTRADKSCTNISGVFFGPLYLFH